MSEKYFSRGKLHFFTAALLVVFLLTTNNCNAGGPEWKIFTSGYSYNKGSVSLSKIIRTKSIADVIRTKDGTIWLACADSYPVFIKNISSAEYLTGIANPKILKAINFKPSVKSRFASLPNGDIWMLTHENLLRLKSSGSEWEGYSTKSINPKMESTIPVLDFDLLGDLNVDSNGNLWVSGVVTSTKTCGLAKLENDKWQYFMATPDIISTITGNNNESDGKGFKFLSGKNWTYEDQPEMMLVFNNLTFDKEGNIWMSVGYYNDKGLCKFSNGLFNLFRAEKNNIPSNDIIDIAANSDGAVHIATGKGLIIMGNENQYRPFEQKIVPTQIVFDNNNNLWWSVPFKKESDPLINRYNSKSGSSFKMNLYNSPLTMDVKRVYIDESNIKYFIVSSITNNETDGLFILQDAESDKYPNWQIYTPYRCGDEGMLQYSLTAGFNDAGWNFYGVSYYMGNRSMNAFKNGKWDYAAFGLSNDSKGLLSSGHIVYAAAKDKKGDIYFGTSNFLYKYEKLCLEVQVIDKHQLSKTMKCMATDRDGNIWLGTTKGLAKYDGNTFTYHNKTNSKLPTNEILSLLVDNSNKVWVGTPDGILCIDGDNQTLFNKKSGLERERVVTIAQNSTGKVYFGITNIMGMAKFLYYAEDGVVKQEPIPETSIISNMVFDKNDNLWISSQNFLLCKKKNGEFISYDSKNSPLLSTFNITQIFVVGSELWLNVETYDLHNSMSHRTGVAGPSDNAPISKEAEILKQLKSKLTNLEPYEETIVLKLEEM